MLNEKFGVRVAGGVVATLLLCAVAWPAGDAETDLAGVRDQLDQSYSRTQCREVRFDSNSQYDEWHPLLPPEVSEGEGFAPFRRILSERGSLLAYGPRYKFDSTEIYEDFDIEGNGGGGQVSIERARVDDGTHSYWMGLRKDDPEFYPAVSRSAQPEFRMKERALLPDFVLDGYIFGDREPLVSMLASEEYEVAIVNDERVPGAVVVEINSEGVNRRVWFDPERGMLPVRMERREHGDMADWNYTCEIDNELQGEETWLAKSYIFSMELILPDGVRGSVHSGTVSLETTLKDPAALAADAFAPDFPDGIDVLDEEMGNELGTLKFDKARKAVFAAVDSVELAKLESAIGQIKLGAAPEDFPVVDENPVADVPRSSRPLWMRYAAVLAALTVATCWVWRKKATTETPDAP